ncbi:hypothetical protein KCP77_14175 [Salmonella enterica subsp. enterica]|nr:hypothetical protein KCP77_14175 [Salmonella enterica subsp. enterica]
MSSKKLSESGYLRIHLPLIPRHMPSRPRRASTSFCPAIFATSSTGDDRLPRQPLITGATGMITIKHQFLLSASFFKRHLHIIQRFPNCLCKSAACG